jgi:predicted permease
MSEVFRRLSYLLNWRRKESELADEMEFHREMSARAGRENFGNTLRLREESADAWGWMWLDRLAQDVRFAARLWLRSPGFTITAILVLAIGIGVNISAFSFFDSVALKLLPVPDAERVVRLERRSPSNSTSEMAYPSFLFYREHAKTLSATIAVLGVPPMQIDDDLQPTRASFATANYFAELGTRALYGRMFDSTTDDRASAAASASPVAVLSYGLWQQRFGGDPSVIGRVIHLDKKPVTVIGITPPAFASLGGQTPDLWLPLAEQPYFVEHSKILEDWTNLTVRMWGRLAPGATAQSAADELRTLTDELRREHPAAVWDAEYIQISPGGHLQVMAPQMYQVAAMVGVLTLLILIVTCTNLGGLMLARAITREHEIAIRVSIGAGRARIFRQLCTESLLLAAAGSLAGLAAGTLATRIIFDNADAPKWLTATPDWRVLLFTVGITLLTTLLFGLVPALQIARQRQRKTAFRQILVGIQVAGCAVLLIVASLLMRAAQHAIYSDPGFGYQQLVSIDPQLSRHDYTPEAARAYFHQMDSRLRNSPGVASVALVRLPPLGHAITREDREIRGRTVKVFPNWVTPEFFTAMQIPLRLGRTFYPGEKNAVIVSESFARQQWPGENPLGQQVGDDGATKDTVIGVAGDAHINAVNDDDALEQYWPAQPSDLPAMSLVVRASGDSAAVAKAAKSISDGIDPVAFPEIRTVKMLYNKEVANIELIASAISAIGLVAVAISCVGIVGLVAFAVRQRTKEIAIRMALGATRSSVVLAVLQQFRWPVAIGLIGGTAAAAAGSRVLRGALYGVSNLDVASYALGCGILAALIALSILLPATRALRLNISSVLHSD